jgi:hypothetical protein
VKKRRRRFPEIALIESFARTFDLPKSAEKSIRVRVVLANFKGTDVIRGDIHSMNGHTQNSDMGPGIMITADEAERLGALMPKLAKAIRMYERQAKNVIDTRLRLHEPKTPAQIAANRIVDFIKGLPVEMREAGIPVKVIFDGLDMKRQMVFVGLKELLRTHKVCRGKRGVKGRPTLWWLSEDKWRLRDRARTKAIKREQEE